MFFLPPSFPLRFSVLGDSVLVGCILLGTIYFALGYPICWHILKNVLYIFVEILTLFMHCSPEFVEIFMIVMLHSLSNNSYTSVSSGLVSRDLSSSFVWAMFP